MFGAAWKSNFWTRCFGPRCPSIRKNIKRNIEIGWNCWNAILQWCRCISGKGICLSSETYWKIVLIHFRNHWRLGIIEKPADFLKGNWWGTYAKFICCPYLCSVFHILDSLATSSPGKKEAKQLQNIFLNHFEEETFKEGRVAVNIPKVD
jgi:hypothetical protein